MLASARRSGAVAEGVPASTAFATVFFATDERLDD
jgi:hypothetical protein